MNAKLWVSSIFIISSFSLCLCGTTSDHKIFLSNNHGLDYKFQGKKDEHRFGVEVEEHRQFHHTITDADGVRLGCYGYELYGEKYATNYIADGKGYRLAPKSSDVITVYAKDSLEPRKASFIGSFGGEEVKSGHIRYLFPEGCEAPKITFDPLTREENRKKFIENLEREALKNQRGAKKLETTKRTTRTTSTTIAPVTESTKAAEELIVTTEKQQQVNDQPEIVTMMPLTPTELENDKNDESCGENGECCENNRLKLILPKNDRSTCGSDMAKISIPISAEKLSQIPMQEILNLSSTRSTMIMLQNLVELAEKYNL